MPEGDWRDNASIRGLVVALGAAGILALIGVAVLAVQGEGQQAQPEQSEQYASDADELLAACLGVDGEESTPTERACEEAREQSDLGAQKRMADAAWWQFGLNIFSTALLAATVGFAHAAWREAKRSANAGKMAAKQAKRQADIAQRLLEESRIPELFIDVPKQGIQIRGHSVPCVMVRFTNVGPTLAVITGGMVGLVFRPNIGAVPDPATPEFYAERTYHVSLNTVPLPPGGEPHQRQVCCLQDELKEQWPAATAPPQLAMSGPNFWLVGWVEFRNQWGDTFASTFGFFYSAPARPESIEDFTEIDWEPQVQPGTYAKHRKERAERADQDGPRRLGD